MEGRCSLKGQEWSKTVGYGPRAARGMPLLKATFNSEGRSKDAVLPMKWRCPKRARIMKKDP